ncbi:hypothetical protein [Roseicyclus elongatus]|uniref:hypothetical protein n=1 Tax=Roseicyclus elongatus TaxID=159346 RepID=UPI00046D0A03|nr:hypothetical protein [Roseibacterium elongatum]
MQARPEIPPSGAEALQRRRGLGRVSAGDGALLVMAVPPLISFGLQHGAIPVLIVLAAIRAMVCHPLGALVRHQVRRA